MARGSMTIDQARPRPEVNACYDHLSGVLGERLFRRLVDLGWVRGEWRAGRTLEQQVTPAGLTGLADWGVDVARLNGSGRKPVAGCTERHGGQTYEDTGGHVGALIRRWLEQQGWIERQGAGLRLTEAGRRGLTGLGCWGSAVTAR